MRTPVAHALATDLTARRRRGWRTGRLRFVAVSVVAVVALACGTAFAVTEQQNTRDSGYGVIAQFDGCAGLASGQTCVVRTLFALQGRIRIGPSDQAQHQFLLTTATYEITANGRSVTSESFALGQAQLAFDLSLKTASMTGTIDTTCDATHCTSATGAVAASFRATSRQLHARAHLKNFSAGRLSVAGESLRLRETTAVVDLGATRLSNPTIAGIFSIALRTVTVCRPSCTPPPTEPPPTAPVAPAA
jgi:hypothetical protein